MILMTWSGLALVAASNSASTSKIAPTLQNAKDPQASRAASFSHKVEVAASLREAFWL